MNRTTKMNKDDLIYIYNKRQAFYYIENGIMPIDAGINQKTIKLYFVFSKKETEEIYDIWCKECEEYQKSKLK